MKSSILLAATVFCFMAGAAAAQSLADNPPQATTICLDVSGRSLPATCRVPGSRLDAREDICLCPVGGERVSIPVCAKGVRPPAESAAYESARQGGGPRQPGRRDLQRPADVPCAAKRREPLACYLPSAA